MAKDPAFLFYSQDFYTGVATLSWEDRGKFISILCLMHQQGRMNEETIRFIVGSVSDNLKAKFSIDDKGLWYNERLEKEAEARAKFTESRRLNGSKGGRPENKKPNAKPNKKLVDNHTVNRMEDENEDVIVIKNTDTSSSYLVDSDDWNQWGDDIVNGNDPGWEKMRGRKVGREEMDIFLSVATRCGWKMETQTSFRVTLKGFKLNGHEKLKPTERKLSV